MSNLAEGSERDRTREFARCLSTAKGSAGEVKSHLYVALDQDYLDKGTFERLYSLAAEIGGMIGSLIKYLRRSEIRGSK